VKAQDFVKIGQSIYRASRSEIGRVAFNNALADLADDIADICANDPHFDRTAFFNACALDAP